MKEIKYLEMFRDLKINKKELSLNLKGKLSVLKMRNIIEVSRENILRLLNLLDLGRVSIDDLMDWVDAIWYIEAFKYKDSEAHCISSILSELEEADIDSSKLSSENIQKYLVALIENRELA